MQLPFFVVHGALVWKLLLALFVAAAFGLVVLRRRRKARKAAAGDVQIRLATVTPLDKGPVSLRGTVDKGSITAVATGQGSTAERTEDLWIDHQGEKIAVVGTVMLVHGTANQGAFFARTNTLGVKAGDEVVISGVAEPRAEDNSSYREAGIGWQIAPDSIVCAVSPNARPRPLGAVVGLTFAALFAIAGYGVLHLIGSRALKHAEDAAPNIAQATLGNFDAVAIAAAMPGSREEALDDLQYWLERRYVRTEEVFQLQLQLRELTGGCSASRLFEAVRLDEALASARRCGEQKLASQVLAFQGRYEEAWNEPGRDARPVFTGTLAIATGRWREASVAADQIGDEESKREPREYLTAEDIQRLVEKSRCFAAMLRGWAGGADPFAKLPYAGMNASCQLFEAVLLPTDQQLAALETIDGSAPRDYGLADLLRRLRIAAGGLPPTRYFDGTTIADLVGFGMPSSTWLIPFEIAGAARDLAPEARARLVGENAERLAHLGDLAGARAALAEMKSLDATDHNDYSNELALALLDPGHAFPAKHDGYIHPGIEEMVRARWGEPVDTNRLLGVYSDECKKRFPAAIAAAQAGDGAELAAVFRECGVSWNVAQKYVLAIAPMIKTHREEVGAAMRLFRNDISTYSVDHIPFRFLDDVAMYRDIARAVGDSESAAAWQKLFDQHVPVLQDRRKLIALLIWTRT